MKLKHIKDIREFFKVIDQCTDKVELVGPDIRLNLKSKIAQLVGLADILAGGNEIEELEVIAYKQEDVLRLINYVAGMK